jgi:hypothetical protein
MLWAVAFESGGEAGVAVLASGPSLVAGAGGALRAISSSCLARMTNRDTPTPKTAASPMPTTILLVGLEFIMFASQLVVDDGDVVTTLVSHYPSAKQKNPVRLHLRGRGATISMCLITSVFISAEGACLQSCSINMRLFVTAAYAAVKGLVLVKVSLSQRLRAK